MAKYPTRADAKSALSPFKGMLYEAQANNVTDVDGVPHTMVHGELVPMAEVAVTLDELLSILGIDVDTSAIHNFVASVSQHDLQTKTLNDAFALFTEIENRFIRLKNKDIQSAETRFLINMAKQND